MVMKLQFIPARKSRWTLGAAIPTDMVQFSGTADITDELKVSLEIVIGEVWIQSRTYFLGCTYAELFLTLNDGTMTDWTQFQPVIVAYKNTTTRTDSKTVEFNPTLKTEAGGASVEVGIGGVSGTTGTESTSEAAFSLPEDSILARPLDEKRMVQWVVPQPQVRGPFRNWIASILRVKSSWDQLGANSGTVKARYQVNFFGENRERMSGSKSFLMKWVTWGEDRRAMKEALAGDVTRPFSFGAAK